MIMSRKAAGNRHSGNVRKLREWRRHPNKQTQNQVVVTSCWFESGQGHQTELQLSAQLWSRPCVRNNEAAGRLTGPMHHRHSLNLIQDSPVARRDGAQG
jgi:hypothetical protein